MTPVEPADHPAAAATGGFPLPEGFLFGASTSAHQVEGNNTASDWWAFENRPGTPLPEPSGDAADSFHRWPQDMDLLAKLGFNAYRFSIEWARIEPVPGRVSQAALAHYRWMVEGARERGLEPVVTLHHFTSPLWFSALGGWAAPESAELFARYAATVAPVLDGQVRYAATINEPNMLALMQTAVRLGLGRAAAHPEGAEDGAEAAAAAGAAAETGTGPGVDVARLVPADDISAGLVRAHHAARDALHAALPGLQVGWTVANQVYQAVPGAEEAARAWAWPREDRFLEAARGDDWIGVQAYLRTRIGPDGPLPAPDDAERTLTGWEFYPAALGEAVRHTAVTVPGVPIVVTENGIATADDTRRIAYTEGALAALAAALRDGADVRGYLHWSALDNYEWGSYAPTFGLIAVDRTTFARTPKPSAAWLGGLARAGVLPAPVAATATTTTTATATATATATR